MDFEITFEVAFAVDPADEPTAGQWIDLSDRLDTKIDVTLGAGRLSGSAQGAATVRLNNTDRAIDPTNSAATYNLVPMRHARLQAVIGATTYPLFRGFVDAWPPLWTGFESWVTVRLVDGFAWLALQDADLDMAEQLSSARITDILDLAGWPAGLRDIGTGVITVTASEQNSANLLRTLQDTADAEDGDLYCAPDGKITFRSRHSRFDASSVMTLGEGGIAFEPATPAWDATLLTNTARVELDDGRVFEVIDDTSVTAYGTRVMPTRDLALSPAEAEGLAMWEVVRFAEPHLWVDGLSVVESTTGGIVAVLLRRVGHLVSVALTPPSGAAVAVDLCVERITHQISDKRWKASMDLSPDFGEGPWFTLDDDVLGLPNGLNKLAP